VFIELGCHDNRDDAAWITENLDEIARNIVLCAYLPTGVARPKQQRQAGATFTNRSKFFQSLVTNLFPNMVSYDCQKQ
jgi:hypothetical protein